MFVIVILVDELLYFGIHIPALQMTHMAYQWLITSNEHEQHDLISTCSAHACCSSRLLVFLAASVS